MGGEMAEGDARRRRSASLRCALSRWSRCARSSRSKRPARAGRSNTRTAPASRHQGQHGDSRQALAESSDSSPPGPARAPGTRLLTQRYGSPPVQRRPCRSRRREQRLPRRRVEAGDRPLRAQPWRAAPRRGSQATPEGRRPLPCAGEHWMRSRLPFEAFAPWLPVYTLSRPHRASLPDAVRVRLPDPTFLNPRRHRAIAHRFEP